MTGTPAEVTDALEHGLLNRGRCEKPTFPAPFQGSCLVVTYYPEFRSRSTPGFIAPHLRCFVGARKARTKTYGFFAGNGSLLFRISASGVSLAPLPLKRMRLGFSPNDSVIAFA